MANQARTAKGTLVNYKKYFSQKALLIAFYKDHDNAKESIELIEKSNNTELYFYDNDTNTLHCWNMEPGEVDII